MKCADCHDPAAPGRTRCPACAAERRDRARLRRAAHAAAGLCVWCSEDVAPGLTTCARHRAELAAMRRTEKYRRRQRAYMRAKRAAAVAK